MIDVWSLKRRAFVRLKWPIAIVIYDRESRHTFYEKTPWWAEAWIWHGPGQSYLPRQLEQEMFSASDLTDPINPNYKPPATTPLAVAIERFKTDSDYRPPSSDISYEVEVYNEITEVWERQPVDFGDRQTDDPEQAKRVRDVFAEQGRKVRALRVETIRSQVTL